MPEGDTIYRAARAMQRAIGGQVIFRLSARGIPNLLLLFLSGTVALSLGLFGAITDRKGWPPLRDLP